MKTLANRLISLGSVATFSAIILGYLWSGRYHYHYRILMVFSCAAVLIIVLGNHYLHRDSLTTLGLRQTALPAATRWFGITTLFACLAISVCGVLFGKLELPSAVGTLTYFLWASVQQHILQNFLVLRGTETIGPLSQRRSWQGILLAAIIFGFLHLPNDLLVALTLLGGLLWCLLFRKAPYLPWAILSQTLMTTCLLAFFKYSPLDQFEVGLGGYRYHFYGSGVKVAGGYDPTGSPFVATLPGPDKGTPALVRIFDTNGAKKSEWVAFEGLDFSGEISVGELGFGPGDEVVVAAGPGGGNPPLIGIFDTTGEELAGFQLDSIHTGYGAWVAVACGRLFVSPGPAPWAEPTVLEVSARGEVLKTWKFDDLGLVNGIRAVGFCDGKKPLDSLPAVTSLLLWGTDIAINPSDVFIWNSDFETVFSFQTIRTTFGAQLTLLHPEQGQIGVAVAPGPLRGYPPLTGVYSLEGQELYLFSPYDLPGNHGANLGAVDLDGDGQDELIFGQGIGPDQPSKVRICRLDGTLVREWDAYGN